MEKSSSVELSDVEAVPSQQFLDALMKVLQRWPSDFDIDLFKNYHRFLVLSEEEFRAHRSMRHQLRIVCSHYLMRRRLLLCRRLISNGLDLEVRLLPTQLQFSFGQKPVLGVVIASCCERFEAHHVLYAAQKILPNVQSVKNSFLVFQKPLELCRLIYLELEKPENLSFSLGEIKLLKKNFKKEFFT